MLMKIIDVSKHNNTIDWTSVKNDSIDGVIIRAGYGKLASQKDPFFEENYKGASEAGLHIGTYWYSYAVTVEEAEQEAQVFLETIKGKKFDMPVYFDIEENSQSQLGKDVCTDITNAFMGIIEAAGYYAGVYSYDYFFKECLDIEIQTKYEIWVARFINADKEYVAPQNVQNWGMHQYSSTEHVSGISGDVDMSKCIKDYPTIIKNAGLNGYSKQQDICDIFMVSATIGGITVTMVQNRSEETQKKFEMFTFNTKTYKTITTLRSGNTTIDKTWSKTVISEVLQDCDIIWKLELDSSGTATAIYDKAGNEILNGITNADGDSVITTTPAGIALGWALAYNNEQTNALQKALDTYQDGVDDCDKINEAEGVGGETDGDGTGGDGTGGDGTGDGTGSGGIKLPDKNFAAIELPEGKGAVGCYKSYNSSGKLTSYSYWYAGSIIVTQNSSGTYTVEYKDGAILTTYSLNIYGEWRESITRYSSFTQNGTNINNWEYYGDVTYK